MIENSTTILTTSEEVRNHLLVLKDEIVVEFKNRFGDIFPNNSKKNETELLDAESVAKMFGVSLQTVYNWRKRGLVSFSKVAGKTYYRKENIEQMLSNGESGNKRNR